MSLQSDILRTEIEKLKQERMSEQVADKLARYWCALQAVQNAAPVSVQTEPVAMQAVQVASVQEAIEPVTDGAGAFHDAVRGKQPAEVYNVLERHFEVLAAIAPKQYAAVMMALDKI